MNRKRMPCFLLSGLLLGPAIGVSRAGPITWEFAGTITSVIDDGDLFGGAVTIGTPFSGSFTFESTTPDSAPDNPNRGAYVDDSLLVTGVVGSVPFDNLDGLGGMISVFNHAPDSPDGGDGLRISSSISLEGRLVGFIIALGEFSGSILTDDTLLLAPLPLELLGQKELRIGGQAPTLSIQGTITTLIPEPVTFALVGLGAIATLARRRRRVGGWPGETS